MVYRLPYRDDSFDGDDVVALAAADAARADVAAARSRLDQANAAWRQAVIWYRTATPKTREIRKRHLDRCLAEALAAAAVNRAERGA